MSEQAKAIQRWSDDEASGPAPTHDDNGDWVEYVDHAAAMKEKDDTVASLRAQLAPHEKSTELLATLADMTGQRWTDDKERVGLHARQGSTRGDVILHLVECDEMELVHNNNSWGVCGVWREKV